jgi:hypothetical protein
MRERITENTYVSCWQAVVYTEVMRGVVARAMRGYVRGRGSSVVVVVVVDGVGWEGTSYGEISGEWGGLVWVWGDGEDETEGVLSVEVEAVEAFLADETEGLV